MNIDLKAIADIDFNELDLENIGSWPLAVKFIASIIVAAVVALLTYNLFVSDEVSGYESALNKETELRNTFKAKYGVASNLEVYKQQMIEMEDKFSKLLKRLPTSSEIPGTLDDLSYVGTTSGLIFNKVGWLPEIEKEFYTELPIKIEVVGQYHEFGEFVSKVSLLPRIVSLHDFSIKPDGTGRLMFSVIAKTYRYKEVQ
ncbi:type 4a pilus biogenesis protein PilO [Pseudoalteromonas denitrificans]|uniref:Type IV pilus assembly protein PilO n=1 Tax=Pseudoalteromonas denitrificans DSM 6059 TaxID=1123010 RepID=A0A1I1K6U6_9GAMM|nr:type 4a pilus biogenesis protein PilO [Pseudoalteromonas denitrificans]SFC53250.1 type IV pilus assembly protein PilO [Pseudoalteromonas denitrificans DSM 6059]